MLAETLTALVTLPLAALPAAPAPAPWPPATTPTRIEAVTVFRNQALVVRRVEARIEDPRRGAKLLLAGLPSGLDESSLQARCSGRSRPTLTGFTIQTLTEPTVPEPERDAKAALEVKTLEKTIRDLGDRDRALADAIAHAEERSQGLRTLRQVYVARIQKGEGEIELSQWMEEQGKVESALEELDAKKRTSAMERRDIAAEIAAAQKRIAELGARPAPQTMRVGELELSARRAGPVTCQVRYLMAGVSWQMGYDARLEESDVQLTQYGTVVNQTGESWDDVALALSTGEAVRSVQMPQPVPHVVRTYMPQVLGRWQRPTAGPAAARAAVEDRAAVALKDADVPPPDATLTQRELYALYTAATRTTVPGSGTPRRVALSTRALRAELRYLALPRTAPGAYLTVRAKHGGDFPLLPGSVRLFLGDDFVGHTQIALTDPGSEITLPFGRDERVRVERERLALNFRQIVTPADEDRKRPELREQEAESRIVVRVRNATGRPIALELIDQLPIAGDATVKVALDPESTPRASASDKDVPGTLRWMLEVARNGTASVRFGYRVRYPQGQQVIGL
jgi:uncharacterized protein (TIGR02231 family)